MHLTDRDRHLLDGGAGPASRMAMSIIMRMAEVQQVDSLLDITAAHIDSSLYMGDATLDYALRLADAGARVIVPTTLNVSGVDPHGWRDWAVPPEWADKAYRQMQAYKQMGCKPTWTCAPYQESERPRFGQQIAWGESSAVVFVNSVLGARTERYPDLLDICAAVTGRVPATGLHLEENRAAQCVLRLNGIPGALQADDSFYPVLGHLIGQIAGDRIPVIVGLDGAPTEDQLKALGAAMASSGSVALFHLVGITPEAPTLEAALQKGRPEVELTVTREAVRAARGELSTAVGDRLDMVALGSPHFSLDEFRRLAPLLEGRTRHDRVRFLITCSRAVKLMAERAGLLRPLIEFGGELTVDTCILTSPMLPADIATLMTNSAKYAYYGPGLLDKQLAFGSLEDCVRSAVEGRITRDEALWT